MTTRPRANRHAPENKFFMDAAGTGDGRGNAELFAGKDLSGCRRGRDN